MSAPSGAFTIVVIANSLHHVGSLLRLASRIRDERPQMRLFALCAAENRNKYGSLAAEYGAALLPVGAPTGSSLAGGSGHSGPARAASPDLASRLRRALYEEPTAGGDRAVRGLLEFFLETSIGAYLRERRYAARLRREIDECGRIFDELRPDAILALSDRHPDIEAAALFAARQRRIKIVIPYVSNYAPEGGVKVRLDSSGRVLQGFHALRPYSLYRLLAYFRFKSQIVSDVLYQPPFILNALKKLGTGSSFPWCSGNGCSDIVCVDTRHTSLLFQEQHVPPAKIRITGGFEFDTLFRVSSNRDRDRAAIVAKYGLDPDKRIVLLAVQQLYEQGMLDESAHWSDIRFLVAELAALDCNLLLSLHPRVDRTKYEFLQRDYRCRIIDEPSANVLPLCDILVASYTSLFVWAALCGIPSFNVDLHEFRFELYDYLHTVSKIKERSQVRPAVASALQGPPPDFSHDWSLLSRDSVFDGQTMQRYLGVLCNDSHA